MKRTITLKGRVFQLNFRNRKRAGTLFAINMLVGTPGGGTYSYEEITAGLAAAGFENVQLIQEEQPMMGLVHAFRPL